MILITGASGNVGKELVNLCIQKKVNCIVGGRRNVKCKEYGVKKVIFLSVIGAGKLPFIPHYAIEKEIQKLRFTYTFLRAGFFMQNLSTTHAKEIRESNELVAPCGDGKTTFIHSRDIAQIGFKAYTSEITDNAIDIAGEDTLSYYQVADKMSKILGRKITYKSPSIPSFILYRMRNGTPVKFALVMAGIYMPTRFGKAECHGSQIRNFLKTTPISLEQFIQEEKQVWM